MVFSMVVNAYPKFLFFIFATAGIVFIISNTYYELKTYEKISTITRMKNRSYYFLIYGGKVVFYVFSLLLLVFLIEFYKNLVQLLLDDVDKNLFFVTSTVFAQFLCMFCIVDYTTKDSKKQEHMAKCFTEFSSFVKT